MDAADVQAWSHLETVDRLTVLAIVDNETDGMSSPCACCDPKLATRKATYTPEFGTWTQEIIAGHMDTFDVSKSVLAGHGLSLLLIVEVNSTKHTLLVDGGPRKDLWSLNATQLGVDLSDVEAVVLTHWHPDHSVGLGQVAVMASDARLETCAPDLVFDLHPDRPNRRGISTPCGKVLVLNPDVDFPELELPGCRLELHSEPHTLLDNTFYVSGVIPRVTSYEQGVPGQVRQMVAGGLFEPDPWIMDERCVAVKVKDLGVVFVSGCSHAGIVNVSQYLRGLSTTTNTPLIGVVGGLHLSGRECEQRISATVNDLVAELDSNAVVLAGHCTGWRAKAALANAMPTGFQPCSVGGKYQFGSVCG